MFYSWVYCVGIFFSYAISYTITGQLWSISTTTLQVRLRVQLNTALFAKTLVRKDVASSSGAAAPKTSSAPSTAATTPAASATTTPQATTIELPTDNVAVHEGVATPTSPAVSSTLDAAEPKEAEESDFSSKAQIMTLMTTDVDRVAEFSWHFFSLVGMFNMLLSLILNIELMCRFADAPIEIVIVCAFGIGLARSPLMYNGIAFRVPYSSTDSLVFRASSDLR